MTLKEEEQVLKKQLEKNAKQEGVTLFVVINDKITGISSLDMYKKFGFVEHGRLPKGVFHRGEYVDHIYMHKRVNDF